MIAKVYGLAEWLVLTMLDLLMLAFVLTVAAWCIGQVIWWVAL